MSATSTGTTCGSASPFIPQKAFLFSGTVAKQPALRRPGRDRRGAVASARDRPGTRLRRGDGGPPRGADHPGRHEPVRRPASAPGDRPRAREAGRDLHLRRQLLRARLRTDARLRAALRGELGWADRDHRRPARRHDHERRPDPRDGRRPDRRQRHPHASCWDPTRPTARSCTRSSPQRRPWHERAPAGGAAGGAPGGLRAEPRPGWAAPVPAARDPDAARA